MKFTKPKKITELSKLIGAEIAGNSELSVHGINEVNVIEDGDIVFVDHPKYYDKTLNSKAVAIIINKKVDCPSGKALLISDDPFRDFNKITSHFSSRSFSSKSISDSATIGKNTRIFPNVFI